MVKRKRTNNGQEKKDKQWPREKGQTMAKRKRTNNDLQNTTQKTKDKATRTPINKMRMNLGAPEGYNEGGTGQRHLTATETV